MVDFVGGDVKKSDVDGVFDWDGWKDWFDLVFDMWFGIKCIYYRKVGKVWIISLDG